jgi:hypothetical protein
MSIKFTPIAVSLHRESEHPLYGEGVIHLKLEDDAGGYFFHVSQDGEGFKIDYLEIKAMVAAADYLLKSAGDIQYEPL